MRSRQSRERTIVCPKRTWPMVAVVVGLGLPGTALAIGPSADPATYPRIYGGATVGTCAWPSVVSLDGGTCTGVLVHPELVLTAAHCLDGVPLAQAEFGNDYRSPSRAVPIVDCTPAPEYPELGFDIAFCRLAQPVTDVPVVPVLAGCEADAITLGQVVTLVGFGVADDDLGDGPKRAVNTDVRDFELPDVVVGGDCRDTCFGDSGGPVFLQLDDGTWRVFGITSEGLQFRCGGGGIYTQIHEHLDWLESESGLDLTPCHDDAGAWAPGNDCVTAPTEPWLEAGSWSEGCSDSPVLARSEVCAARTGEITPNPETCFDEGDDGGAEGGTAGFGDGSERGDADEGCACALRRDDSKRYGVLAWGALGALALLSLIRRRSPRSRPPGA